MLSLPPIADAGRVWYLPLSAEAAAVLMESLVGGVTLEDENGGGAVGQAGAVGGAVLPDRARQLVCDPPLLLYLTARHWAGGGAARGQAPTLRALAEHLSCEAVIEWLSAPRCLPTYPGGCPATLATLAAAARLRAYGAARETDWTESPAVVGELIADAHCWCGNLPEGMPSAGDPSPQPADGWSAWLQETVLPQRVSLAGASRQTEPRPPAWAAEAWPWRPADVCGGWLPAVARLARRRAALESDFAGQLGREKLAALQQFAYGASHEINNPLANIASRAQLLLQTEEDGSRRRALNAIERQAFRAHDMIADLMLFANPPRPQCDWWNVHDLLAEAIRPCRQVADDQRTELHLELPAKLLVWADASQFALALQAVVKNALEATQAGNRIAVTAGRAPAGKAIELQVQDDGPGLSTEALRHAFDPYYSGREAGRGLGFGLCKAYRIMELHGGSLEVISDPHGTTVRFRWPLPARAVVPSTTPAVAAARA